MLVENPFDIIKVLTDDTLAWLEASRELGAARLRVWELLADSPGEYIVFNQETKKLVAHFSIHEAPETSLWLAADDEPAQEPQPEVSAHNDDFDEYLEELQPAVA
jgi:hypothetical protein